MLYRVRGYTKEINYVVGKMTKSAIKIYIYIFPFLFNKNLFSESNNVIHLLERAILQNVANSRWNIFRHVIGMFYV